MKTLNNYTKGIIRENPVLVLVLGTCPTLATSTSVLNALGMGLAATVVLLFSNILISALRKVIPDKVRIPCYIVLIAGLVTAVQMLVKAYAPALNDSLGIYLPLIVVNCIILGRAEMFASKNNIFDSAVDALGMGTGFTLALFLMATLREVFGNGSFCGMPIPVLTDNKISILTMAPGGFFVFGLLMAMMNKWAKHKPQKKDFGCEGCPQASVCSKAACAASGTKENGKEEVK